MNLLLIQSASMAKITGVSDEQVEEATRINRSLYEIAPNLPENQYQVLLLPWFRIFLSLDPDQYLSKVSCTVLAITGEKDIQCPPEENLAAMEESLKKAGNTHYTLRTMPGLNHLFQTSETGSPLEYERIPEIIAPAALQEILNWLDSVHKFHPSR
jgi:fermentation-respiration switch protein FrsA (DUF1100 family)